MNSNAKDGKKRIAHVGSFKTVENAGKPQCDDYLASIMEQMDSNDKQIVSYEQLNDYRKSKFKPVLPDLEFNQPIETFGAFKLKKKPCPLMAKCKRNLKYIKHNRSIPKPRAHVGPFSKETLSKLSTKFQIKPKTVQKNESSSSIPLPSNAKRVVPSVANKLDEEWDRKILESQEIIESKKRKISKQRETEKHFSVETNDNAEFVSNDKQDSSEESDNFERFIKQQVQSSKETSEQNSKRKKVLRKKSFKRIKKRKSSSSESRNNSLQFDFDNPRDDFSDDSESNETLSKSPQVDFSSNSSDLINKDDEIVKKSVDILSNDLSVHCISSPDTIVSSSQLPTPDIQLNQSDNSLEILKDANSTSEQELCQSKNASEKEQADGFESDDCMILDNPLPDFNIQISAVKSVAMLPTSDEDESAEAVLESNSPQKENIGNTSATLHTESQIGILNQQAILSFKSKSLDSNKLDKTDSNRLIQDEGDDCIIIDEESLRDTDTHKQNCKDSSSSIEVCARKDTKQSVIPPLKVSHENLSLGSIKEASIIENFNQKGSLASSRYKPDTVSDKNVWDVLKEIDFEKLKTLPQQSPTQHCFIPHDSLPYSLAKGKIKSEKLSHEFKDVHIQNSTLPQEKHNLTYTESYSNYSISCKNHEDVELINLSDNEDASQNGLVESTSQGLDFISPHDVPVESTSSISQENSISRKCTNFEIKIGDVSSSSVLDDSDLNFHNSLILNEFNYQFPIKPEATSVNRSLVKKEPHSTSDELDISSSSSLLTFYSAPENDVYKLLNLYQKEYQQYKEIQNTGRNLSDGLNLLLNKQVDKLRHIKSSIKNIVKHEHCFKKESKNIKPEIKPIKCNAKVKKEPDQEKKTNPSSQLSESEHPELSIYTESVLQGIQKVVGKSLPPESGLRAEKVKEQLQNVKCAQCGKTASAACQGCFKVFYCSTECGMSDWEKGHSISCGS